MTASGGGLLAVIPARGGSKGLPGKNIRPFAGLPLIAHSILCAKLCPEINACVVSTDSPEIAETAKRFGAGVPFLRPAELARDDTAMWPVLRHALEAMETDGRRYDALLLLEPTTPFRLPEDIAGVWARLQASPEADGIVSVSRPDFNPIWNGVVDRGGWMGPLVEDGQRYVRRQDVPDVYRINGMLYLWRAAFVRSEIESWRAGRRHLMYEVPAARSLDIDTLEQFEHAEWLVREGKVGLPWLSQASAAR